MSRLSNHPVDALPQTTVHKRVYSFDELEAAIVVYDWMVEQRRVADSEETLVSREIKDIAENYGWSAMRSMAAQAGIITEKCWHYAHGIDARYSDDLSWDYDFVPMVCWFMDWQALCKSNQYGDTLWEPNIEDFMAKVEMARALGVSG